MFCLPRAINAAVFSFYLAEDSLSMTAENIPLQTILRELAAQGITIKIDPAINPLISANFQKRPIEAALDSLLRPASYTLLWHTVPAGADKPSLQLAAIQVFQTGKKDQMQELPPRRNEVITKNSKGVLDVKDEILSTYLLERIWLNSGNCSCLIRQLL